MHPNIQRSISLPNVVNLSLPGQYISVVMNALNDSGPVRMVMPVIQAIEQQLRAQSADAPAPAPAGGRPPVPPAPVVPTPVAVNDAAPSPVERDAAALEAAAPPAEAAVDPAFQ